VKILFSSLLHSNATDIQQIANYFLIKYFFAQMSKSAQIYIAKHRYKNMYLNPLNGKSLNTTGKKTEKKKGLQNVFHLQTPHLQKKTNITTFYL